ncbi:MAG: polyprenol phosphomannose-dependent alpha 1,6 mannosyltransferase MptB [Chloroflexota bacterium]
MAKTNSTFSNIPRFVLLAIPFFGFVGLAIWFPLFPNVHTVPQLDVFSFSSSLFLGVTYALIITLLYGLYLYIYRRLKVAPFKMPLATQLLAATFYGLPMLMTYPINATDIYRYVIRGRIKSTYGLNQFTAPPNAIPDDLFAPLAGEWADATSPYGPIWELVATAVTAVTQDNLGLGLVILKLLGLGLHLAIGVLIWQMAKSAAVRSADTASWLWLGNPALLFIFVQNGHNDALMLGWGMLAVYFLRGKRPYLAMFFAILAPLTKPIGLLILPFIGLAAWRLFPNWKQKLGYMFASIGLFILLGWVAFLPFGSPLALVQRLQGELIGGASFSPVTLFILFLLEFDVPFTFARLSWILQSVYGGVGLWLMWLTFNGRSPLRSTSNMFWGYLLQAFNFRIWYASWLFPWLLIEEKDDDYWLNTAVYFLLTTQLSVIIYSHIRAFLLGNNVFYSHLIGVLFTFGLPFLLASRYRVLAAR